MVEWSITVVLKTTVPRGTGGSNPSLSAEWKRNPLIFSGFLIFLNYRSQFRSQFHIYERLTSIFVISSKTRSSRDNISVFNHLLDDVNSTLTIKVKHPDNIVIVECICNNSWHCIRRLFVFLQHFPIAALVASYAANDTIFAQSLNTFFHCTRGHPKLHGNFSRSNFWI